MKKVFMALLIIISAVLFSTQVIYASEEMNNDKKGLVSQKQEVTKIYAKSPKVSVYVTRAEFFTQLHKTLDLQIKYFAVPDVEKIFSDVKNSDLYATKVYDLVTAGIIDDKDKLNPNKKIKRQEAMHYMVRAYDYINGQDIEKSKVKYNKIYYSKYIKDIKNIDTKYYSDFIRAYKLDFAKSKSNKMFRPKVYLAREEMLSLMEQLNKSVIKKDKGNLLLTGSYDYLKNGFEISAQLKNTSKKDITIDFSSGQQYNFILLDKNNKEIYNWEKGRMFTMALTKITLKPGEEKVFKELLPNEKYSEIINKAVYLKVQIPGRVSTGNGMQDKVVKIENKR